MRCSGCRMHKDPVRYCDRKCQKIHFKAGHKEDCRLVGLKLRCDAANDAHAKEQVLSDRAQLTGDLHAHLTHLAGSVDRAKEAVDLFKQLGTRAVGMELQLCSFIALGLARLHIDEECERWLDRLFAAIPTGKAEDVTTTPYWTRVGACISGEQFLDDDGLEYCTQDSWLAMIAACEGNAWSTRNQVRLMQARRGACVLMCGMCEKPLEGISERDAMAVHEALPCRHVSHVGCLPEGFQRAARPGLITPGASFVCNLCVRTGQPLYRQGTSMEELVKREKDDKKQKKLEKRVSKLVEGKSDREVIEEVMRMPQAEREKALKRLKEYGMMYKSSMTPEEWEKARREIFRE